MQTSVRALELCNRSPPPEDVDTESRVIVPFNKEVNINGFPFLFEHCEDYLWVSDILAGTQSQYCHHTLATMLRASTTTAVHFDNRTNAIASCLPSHPYILSIPADEHDVSTVRVELRPLGDHRLMWELGDPPKVHVHSVRVGGPGASGAATGSSTTGDNCIAPLGATTPAAIALAGDSPVQLSPSAAPETPLSPLPTTTTASPTAPQSATGSSLLVSAAITTDCVSNQSTLSVSAAVSGPRPPIVNAVPGTTAAAVAALSVSRGDVPPAQNTPLVALQSTPATSGEATGSAPSLASASASHSTSASISSGQTTTAPSSTATLTPRDDPVNSITVADPALPFLARLPVAKITSRMAARCEVCVICTHDYTEGSFMRRLPCFHAFHQICIDAWLRESVRTQTCPLCKQCVRAMIERNDATTPWIREEADEESKTWRK